MNIIKTTLLVAVMIVGVGLLTNWLDRPTDPTQIGEAVYLDNKIIECTTSSIPATKRSIYHSAPTAMTSTDPTSTWHSATSTDNTGTPFQLADKDTGRGTFYSIEIRGSGNIDFWLRNATETAPWFDYYTDYSTSTLDTTDLAATSTLTWGNGINLDDTDDPWIMQNYGIDYSGKIWALASSTSATTTIMACKVVAE